MDLSVRLLSLAQFAGLGVCGILLIVRLRLMEQQRQDRARRYYLLSFPRDLEFKAVVSFFRSLSGLTNKSVLRMTFVSVPTLVIEVEADERGIRYRLGAPGRYADFIIPQLRERIPSINASLEKEQIEQTWGSAVELRLTTETVPLRIPEPEALAGTILAAVSSMKTGEAVMLQWVISPAEPVQSYFEGKDQQQKHSDQIFRVTSRVAARSPQKGEDKKIIRRIFSALTTAKGPGVTFNMRPIPASFVEQRMNRRATPLMLSSLMNVVELAACVAFPAKVNVPGLPQGRSRHLVADPIIPQEGIIIGNSNFPADEKPLALNPTDLTKHCHILGSTGSGKSTLIENMALQAMNQGFGVCVIDPHGDSFENLINRIPRGQEPCLLDLTDSTRPVGFNVLEGDPYMVTNRVLAVFDRLYDIYKMPLTADILRSTVLTLAQKGLTLLDIPAILAGTDNGQRLRDRLIRNLDDPALKDFWRQYNALKPERKNEVTAPLLRRLRPFETWPSLRGCIGQVKSGFDMDVVLAQGESLLVNLSKGRVGEEEAKLFGSLFVARFWSAVQKRAAIPAKNRKPYLLFVDEFQNYVNLPVNFGDVLAESRKYGLGFVMAHQHMAQLPFDLREAVMPNARSKIIFQTSSGDANALAREMPPLKPDDFQNLGPYEAIAKLNIHDQAVAPATIESLPPGPSRGSGRVVRAASALRYGRPLSEVEAELRERQRASDETPRKVIFGREEDG